jgi:dTDP-4-amino-4,6-dideoxygalactose transaminase
MIGPLKRYNSFARDELKAVTDLAVRCQHFDAPLSGYLAGNPRGGPQVFALEDAWCEVFGVKHAIACNSATSGLLAAAFAVDLGKGDEFLAPALTMSATAAAPMFTGATPRFCDVDDRYFALSPGDITGRVKAVFLTHLFGAAIDESWWAGWGRQNGIKVIVDAAQAPLAKEPKSDRYAGTIADIGVFSLNVHKHFQCGEGGVIVTNDDAMGEKLRHFINHGENANRSLGLNLRMTEVCAAIALRQLRRADSLVQGRIDQAEAILAAIGTIPGLRPPMADYKGSRNVYYTIPFLIDLRTGIASGDINAIRPQGEPRAKFCAELRNLGVPIVEGYVSPLYRMPAFAMFDRPCPIAEDLHDERLFYFENCAYSPTDAQIRLIGHAFRMAAEQVP